MQKKNILLAKSLRFTFCPSPSPLSSLLFGGAMRAVKSISASFTRVAFFVTFVCLVAAGCAVSMATKQPDKKDLSVLRPRVTRSQVVAELGPPAAYEQRDGRRVEVFAFTQGYSKATKTTRALAHGVADVITLGLWEVVGIPAETYFSGTDVKVEITYDEKDCVEQVSVLEGEQLIKPIPVFTGP